MPPTASFDIVHEPRARAAVLPAGGKPFHAGGEDKPAMRIIVWGINYAPEVTGIAPCNVRLCEGLAARGHSVEMVTSFAYYPAWKKRRKDKYWLFRTDKLNGIPVHRCWQYVPWRVTAVRRILHEASFVLTSFLKVGGMEAPDVYIVVSPPLLLGVAAWVASYLKYAPFVFHVQDLQPDAALGLGMLRPNAFTRLLYLLETIAYCKSALLSGITPGMLDRFRQKGQPSDKLVYFPNSVDAVDPAALPAPGAFRRKHGIAPGEFLAVYSGNLGFKQGIEILIEAAGLVTRGNVRMVICGGGSRLASLEATITASNLGTRILLLPLQETEAYHEMLVDADVCLITQQRGSGRSFFPSKLLTALAFGKPVVTVSEEDSELYRAHREGGFGPNVLPGQPRELAGTLEKLAGAPALLEPYRRASLEFGKRFDTDKVLDGFEESLRSILHEG